MIPRALSFSGYFSRERFTVARLASVIGLPRIEVRRHV
jgi:hypothetical protein